MTDKTIRRELLSLYRVLYRSYGPQHWWPGDTAFEVMVGAVLTQNTAWVNVEKAVANLKKHRLLSPAGVHRLREERLAALIRPSGYFNIKAKRLKRLAGFVMNRYRGSVTRMFRDEAADLRQSLLAVHGIGPETADSILLYAGGKLVFVVDAYTKRIFSRHGLLPDHAGYQDVQRLFMEHLSRDVALYNEYHALIVRLGKERCKKSRPRCSGCPLDKSAHKIFSP